MNKNIVNRQCLSVRRNDFAPMLDKCPMMHDANSGLRRSLKIVMSMLDRKIDCRHLLAAHVQPMGRFRCRAILLLKLWNLANATLHVVICCNL